MRVCVYIYTHTRIYIYIYTHTPGDRKSNSYIIGSYFSIPLYSLCAIIAKVLNYRLKVSLNYSHTITFTFGLMPLEKVRTPYPPSYGLNSITVVLIQGWLWHLNNPEC